MLWRWVRIGGIVLNHAFEYIRKIIVYRGSFISILRRPRSIVAAAAMLHESTSACNPYSCSSTTSA